MWLRNTRPLFDAIDSDAIKNNALTMLREQAALEEAARKRREASGSFLTTPTYTGTFAKLEDEMCQWDPLITTESPNRVDALVWAITQLMGGTGGKLSFLSR